MCPVRCNTRRAGMCRRTAVGRLAVLTLVTVSALYSAELRLRSKEQPRASWSAFGGSVAATSGFLFVAANSDTSGKGGAGTVHLFERRDSAWVHAGTLSVPEATVEDDFGISMAADGAILAVGAQYADVHGENSGVVYVFERRRNTWHQAAVLSPGDATPGDEFGLTVSVSGDTIAVGARLEDSHGRDAGATYLYQRRGRNWQQVAKLTASDAAAGDLFGRVSLDNRMMVVSADLNDDRGNAAGKAYAFEERGRKWTEVARFHADHAAPGDEFGFSLVLRGGNAVFGAVGADSHGRNSGAAYVFERQHRQWVQTARLTASDGATSQLFGFSVSALADLLVVGAPGDRNATGAAYVFERRAGAWTQTRKLGASDAAPLRWFGNSVAATDDTIVVGALTDAGTHAAGAYVFERRDGSWSEVARLVRP